MLRRLILLIIAGAFLWSMHWVWQARRLAKDTQSWFETRQTSGWVAEYDDLRLRGFPNRLDQSFERLTLFDPRLGVAWSAEQFQLLRVSYNRHHVIAAWSSEQRLSWPDAKAPIHADGLRASLVRDSNDLEVKRSDLEAETLTIDTRAGPLSLAGLAAALRRQEGTTEYRVFLSATALIVPGPPGVHPELGDAIPQSLDSLRLDATVRLDRALTTEYSDELPRLTGLNITLGQVGWGELDLQIAGRISFDETGHANGRLMLKARNWQEVLNIARKGGYVGQGLADRLEQGLTLLSRQSGHRETLDLPLVLESGQIKLEFSFAGFDLGAVNLGRVPPLPSAR